jgi:hypothetical protein
MDADKRLFTRTGRCTKESVSIKTKEERRLFASSAKRKYSNMIKNNMN